MQYIIDGHNLIPHVGGISLQDLDDEQALIDTLTPWLRAKRSRAVVFFDRAAPGQAGERNFGLVRAVFVPQGQTADDAIAAYVQKLKGAARNFTLVSSDRMVQAAGRAYHAAILSSDQFARQLDDLPRQAKAAPEVTLSPEEVSAWEELFNQYGGQPPDGLIP